MVIAKWTGIGQKKLWPLIYVLRNKTGSEANSVRVYDDKEKRKSRWTDSSDEDLLQLSYNSKRLCDDFYLLVLYVNQYRIGMHLDQVSFLFYTTWHSWLANQTFNCMQSWCMSMVFCVENVVIK